MPKPQDHPSRASATGKSFSKELSDSPLKPNNAETTLKEKQREQFARAASEDDDGYDPWSDRPAETPLYEEDPWR